MAEKVLYDDGLEIDVRVVEALALESAYNVIYK